MSTLTPWSCPLLPGVYSAVEAKLTISTRADADVWLTCLTGKTLACNCRCPPGACWAGLLQSEFIERFETHIDHDTHHTFELDESDLDDPEELPVERYITGHD